MAFGLYTLLEAGLLLINAIAILNEQRFLAKRTHQFHFVHISSSTQHTRLCV